ncbi:trigger factor [uncultured Draconibacterium sp.]|uniref:trigger factor n=1 Tax=uncultured Draconibacterium sp. TaxID=1573823 RepID=UPI0029C617D6|nr:trigger factor [uncultured Draconibacterium sp.]
MNINLENIDQVNAVINLTIEKTDYEKQVADVLKDYRQKATIPGFRPGKVPAGLIKKRFGTAVLVEEINKLISQNLSKYMIDEKLPVLGEPMPNDEKQKAIDWEKDESFEFVFDVALAPEVKVSLDKRNKYTYYNIAVSDDMIQQQVDMAASQLGENLPAEEAKEDSTVRGNFVQLDAEGNEVEGGIAPEGVLLAVDKIKDEEVKNAFVGCKKDDIIVFNPIKAFENNHEVSHMLNIKHEEADTLESDFRYTVTEILQFQKAELNEELFKKLYGEETEIKTLDDFKAKIKEDLAKNLVFSSDHKFTLDTRDTLVEKTELEMPEEFLKRWLVAVNKELTQEQIETEFPAFILDLKWQLIKDAIAKENELKIEAEEAEDFAKKMALAQYQQYGIHDVPEDQLESFAKMMLDKPEERERIYKKLLEDKVIEVVKEKVTVQEEEVSQEKFNEMMQAAQ